MSVVPFMVDSLSLGGYIARQVPAMLGPFPASLQRRQGFTIDGLLSHGALRRTRLTLDFDRMTIWIDPQ